MIELNLLVKKKSTQLPSVLGMDLNQINFAMIGIAIAIYYIPDYVLHSYFDGKIAEVQATIAKMTEENNKITAELSKDSNLKARLDAYNAQVEKLKNRSAQVDEILKIRTNPKKILEKLARSVTDDLWFDVLKINEDKTIIIEGGSYSPRSIGEFITIINDSPFFGNSITPTKQENKQETVDGVSSSYEYFELKGEIKNFDMRSK